MLNLHGSIPPVPRISNVLRAAVNKSGVPYRVIRVPHASPTRGRRDGDRAWLRDTRHTIPEFVPGCRSSAVANAPVPAQVACGKFHMLRQDYRAVLFGAYVIFRSPSPDNLRPASMVTGIRIVNVKIKQHGMLLQCGFRQGKRSG